MDIQLSSRTNNIKPSPTLAINARAKQLKAEGGDIISLSVGEPDFDTPLHIKEAAIKAIHDGMTKYTAVDGIPELKNSIINKFKRENDLHYLPEQVLVSTGAKQSIFNLLQAVINPGDEVIIPAPYWTSYPDMVLLNEGFPVIIESTFSQDYKIQPDQLDKAITPKTKLIMLNSPNNPSGMAYTRNELGALAEILLKYPDILIVTDDIYEHILWANRPFSNIINACPELYERTVVINGVSKAYSMTGWRIGYAAGNKKIISGMKKVQSQSTSNPNSIAQYAAVAALDGDQQCVLDLTKEFRLRHDFVLNALKSIPQVKCHPSHGTFYSLPDFSEVINNMSTIHDDLELAEHLLVKAGVAVVPGTVFGAPGCIRLSFAMPIEKLSDALKRIKTVIQC